MPTRILCADDHVVVRRGLRLLIEQEPDFTVIAEASNGAEAMRLCRETLPDVAVLDIGMPISNGITTATEIRSEFPETGIVMLTYQVQVDVIRRALYGGANGYVTKDSSELELFEAIRAARSGQRYICQRAADIVIGTFFYSEPEDYSPSGGSSEPLSDLSSRERQVLQLLAEGERNNRIAVMLNLSPKTVETYRSRLMHKLGVTSFAELIRTAIRGGLVDSDG
ncbi:MAG: response regulator [Spirochaetales bacterium]